MKTTLTFILPTRNRKAWIGRAIESCLACENDVVAPFVMVIDGESTDGSFEMLGQIYGQNSKVKLFREPKSVDFMTTCLIGVGKVTSDLVTFMYDDDFISPYFKDAVKIMLDKKHDFIMGYGRIYPVESIYPFKQVNEVREQNPIDVLMGHYGDTSALKFPVLPVSPICCVVKTSRLVAWLEILRDFTKVNEFRNYFLMKRNIGPDLLIFISSIIQDLEAGQNTLVASTVLGQFSEHTNSMSIQYGSQHLTVGYWLAKVWGFEQLLRLGKKAEAAKAGAYIVVFGISLVVVQVKKGMFKWTGSQLREITKIFTLSLRHGLFLKLLGSMESFISKRLKSGKNVEAAKWLYGQSE